MNAPIPGSMIICDFFIPLSCANSILFFRNFSMCRITFVYVFGVFVVRGVLSLEYIKTIGHLYLLITSIILLSPLSAVTSFIMFAPSSIAFFATSALYVSIDMGRAVFFLIAFRIGIVLSNSSFRLTAEEPGPVDSPPISIISAPSSSNSRALFTAFSSVLYRPPSLKESGVAFSIPIIVGEVFDIFMFAI